MGTKAHTIMATLVYIGMAFCLTGLLATALIENFPHQIFGIAFFVLLVCHLVLNRFWIRHSLSGHWDPSRIFFTIIAAALALLSIAQAVNCLLLSSFFWSMLPQQFALFSSSLHMTLGTWIFCLAAVHFGLNANALIGNRLHLKQPVCNKEHKSPNRAIVGAIWVLLLAISAYGIIEFFQLQLPNYLFMFEAAQSEAAASLIARFFQYLCVGIAIAGVTHCASVFVQYCARKLASEAEFKL